MFRIFFVLLAAAIITFASVLIGLHLMRKVQEAENTPSSAVGEGISAGSSYSGETPVLAKVKDVFGMGLVIGDYPTDEELDEALDALAESYDTVVFPLCDESGNLIYQSPAVCALVRMQPEDAEGLGRVTHALSAAKSRGLYVIVSVNASDSASSSAASSAADAALMGELASFGADEILVFPGTDTFDYGTANRLRVYLAECAGAIDARCGLGIVLPASAYLDPDGAMQLQMIASSVSCLCIRFSLSGAVSGSAADVYKYVSDTIASLEGSFSVYGMRVVIESANSSMIAAQYRAAVDRGVDDLIFTAFVDPAILDVDFASVAQPEPQQASSAPLTVSNPYMTTSEDAAPKEPEPASPAAEEPAALPEEPAAETPAAQPEPAYTDGQGWY